MTCKACIRTINDNILYVASMVVTITLVHSIQKVTLKSKHHDSRHVPADELWQQVGSALNFLSAEVLCTSFGSRFSLIKIMVLQSA